MDTEVSTSLTTQLNNEIQNIPLGIEQEMILSINLKAPFFEDDDRAPIDLIAVVDVSGSMRGHIDLVRKTLGFMVGQLGKKDSFCMVSFSSGVKTALKFTLMNSDGKSKALDAISALSAGGGTFLSGGLLHGVKLARSRDESQTNEICSVLLFTDGAASTGIKDPGEMKEAINNLDFIVDEQEDNFNQAKRNKPRSRQQTNMQINQVESPEIVNPVIEESDKKPVRDVPFTIYTFGYGESHQAELLREIANSRDGVYYFIEHEDSIADSFTDCLGGLLSIVGQNIDITIKAHEDIEINDIMASYRTTTREEKKDYTIHLGDIQSEEQRDILIKVNVPAFRAEGSYDLITWTLNYFNVLTCEQEEELVLTSVINVMEVVEDAGWNNHVLQQKYRVMVSSTLKSVQQLFNDPENCKVILQVCLDTLLSSPIANEEFILFLIEDVNEVMEELNSKKANSYQLENKMMMHSKQRNAQGSESKARYVTNKKKAMKSKYKN